MKLYYIAWPDGRKEGPMPQDSLFYGMVHGVYKESCLVWTDGMESWDALMFPLPEVKRRRRSLFSLWKRLTGLEGLSVIEFFCSFSQVFRRHSLQEVIELTASGTDHTTPSIHELSPTWPKPWLYVRIALFFLILYIISFCGFYCLEDGNNMNYVPLHSVPIMPCGVDGADSSCILACCVPPPQRARQKAMGGKYPHTGGYFHLWFIFVDTRPQSQPQGRFGCVRRSPLPVGFLSDRVLTFIVEFSAELVPG